ncbi:MAG TPA: hypothetical protein VFZ52_04405, partial [Chryseolinea sp.]
ERGLKPARDNRHAFRQLKLAERARPTRRSPAAQAISSNSILRPWVRDQRSMISRHLQRDT